MHRLGARPKQAQVQRTSIDLGAPPLPRVGLAHARRTNQPTEMPFETGVYHSYEEVGALLREWASKYPELCELSSAMSLEPSSLGIAPS